MFSNAKKLFSLLTSKQKKQFYSLQILVICMAFSEIIAVASIVPFMALVGDMSLLSEDTLVAKMFIFSGVNSETEFVFLLGVCVLVALVISAVISMFTTWKLSMFATRVGTEISDTLYSYYLKQNWLFHASGSSANLTKKIANETTRVTAQVLLPLMQMNARIALALFMSTAIFLYDPKVAIVGLFVFALAYFMLYKLVRKRLQINGRLISKVYERRFSLMNEGFGGIKDVLLLGRDADFITRFKNTGENLAYSQGTNTALAQVPRYFMELVAFGSMISLVLYLISNHDGNLGMILPVMSVYALASIKLLPAFQQIYSSVATIKGNISAFESIRDDLEKAMQEDVKTLKVYQNPQTNLVPRKHIVLENVSFVYPEKLQPVLKGLSLRIPVNSVIGIVGPSGAGKSTAIDILLGLISPQKGELKVDDTVITPFNCRAWQNTIGFVPQNIFLSEGSIAENVAFGIPESNIDYEQVKKALTLAHLDDLLETLDEGVDTKVGERGVQLSGGQRQRIGIARALYQDAEVLVFDEATSALDGITEKMIMEAIHDFSGHKTIIMIAHRLKTVQKCDQIYYIDQGKLIDQGTYQELIEKNLDFKRMSNHA